MKHRLRLIAARRLNYTGTRGEQLAVLRKSLEAALRLNDFDTAEKVLEVLGAADPDSADSWYEHGSA